MGKRGPKPKAPGAGDSYKTRERRAAAASSPATPTSAPKKPAWLRRRGGFASKHFDQLVKLMGDGRLAETDADAVAGYCLLWEHFVQAEDLASRTKVHPSLDRAARALGLTPAERARLAPPPAAPAEASGLDSFLRMDELLSEGDG